MSEQTKKINYAVIQKGACVFGVGSTKEEAIYDASKWLENEHGRQGGMTEDEVSDYIDNNEDFVIMPSHDDEFADYMANQGAYTEIDGEWFDGPAYVAISSEGYLYGRGHTAAEAEKNAVTAWTDKWGGDAEPMPDFNVKLDDGQYDE